MNEKSKAPDPIPDEFASYEEAAEFWDAHDTMDYPGDFETVSLDAKLERRRFEVALDPDLMKALSEEAHQRGIAVGRLVNELLREKVHA